MKKLINFFKEDDGATMPEYALMIALIAAVCIGVSDALGLLLIRHSSRLCLKVPVDAMGYTASSVVQFK